MKHNKFILALTIVVIGIFLFCSCESRSKFADTDNVNELIEDSNASEINEPDTVAYNVTNYGVFSGGIAWMDYYDENGIEYSALIDTNMNILFKHSLLIHRNVNSGLAFYYDENKNGFILNSEGKTIFSTDNGDFDMMVGIPGDGYFILYKRIADINNATGYLRVVGEKGEYVSDWIDIGIATTGLSFYNPGDDELQDSYLNIYQVYNAGCNVFGLYNGYESILLSVAGGKFDGGSNLIKGKIRFEDNKALAISDGNPVIIDTNLNLQNLNIDSFSSFTAHTECNKLIYKDDNVWHIHSVDSDIIFNDYPADNVNIFRVGKSLAVLILGADQKKYFSVLDVNANLRFEPIAVEELYFETKIFYSQFSSATILIEVQSFDESIFVQSADNKYYRLSFDGTIIEEYDSIRPLEYFTEDVYTLHWGKYSQKGNHYVDKEGNILL